MLAASTLLAVLPITYLIAGQSRSSAEAGVRVHFKASLPGSAPIEAQLPKELLFQPGELFTITLTVRNRSHREVWAKVAHRVEPEIMAKYMGMVDCGSFLPFRLAPRRGGGKQLYLSRMDRYPETIEEFYRDL